MGNEKWWSLKNMIVSCLSLSACRSSRGSRIILFSSSLPPKVFVLLKKLKEIFDLNYNTNIGITNDDIQMFMEEIFNKPGADEFLTPREVIRDFLNILSLLRQNPNAEKQSLITNIEIADERPDESVFDSIEEL